MSPCRDEMQMVRCVGLRSHGFDDGGNINFEENYIEFNTGTTSLIRFENIKIPRSTTVKSSAVCSFQVPPLQLGCLPQVFCDYGIQSSRLRGMVATVVYGRYRIVGVP